MSKIKRHIICRSTCIYRRESNCPDDVEEQQVGAHEDQQVDESTARVEQVEDASETITTPPDSLVAREIDAIVNPKKSNSNSAASSSSSSSSEGMASHVHLQAPKAKRYTPAAKQRHELTASMLELFQRETKNLSDETEDELDFSFAAYAKRMRMFLSNEQKEELNTEIGSMVSTAIKNAKAGIPLLQKAPPLYRQAVQPFAPNNMQNSQQQVRPSEMPPPPELQPAVQQGPHQQQQETENGSGSFYIAGPTSMNYEMSNSFNFQTM